MLRTLALLLTVLTGFSGLVYEVAWQKSFATLLGSHSEATAAVLAIFLGGLSTGYAVFGRVCRRVVAAAARAGRPPRILLLYGAVEAGIGVWALLFPALFAGTRALSVWLHVPQEGLAFAADVALTALLIGPPTVLMGGTIPLLTQALAHDLRDATRFHAFVYGFNTAGAFAGALTAGFFLIPLLGIPGTLRAMGIVNLAAGAAFGILGLRGRETVLAEEAVARRQSIGVYGVAALLLGFAMMSIQTVLIRLGGLSFGASHFTFAMVVAVFVLCLALGSLAVSAFERIPRAAVVACPLALAVLFAALYPWLDKAPYAAHVLRTLFRDIGPAFYPYYFSAFLGILVVFALPVGLSGASLPLLFHAVRREVGELGSVAGRLYSWNTIGNLLGALLGGYALLYWLDLHHVYRLGVAAVAGAGVLLALRLYALPRLPLAVVSAAALAAFALLPAWDPNWLAAGYFRMRQPTPSTFVGWRSIQQAEKVIYYDDDPTTSVAVKEHVTPKGASVAIVNNGKSDGSLALDYPTMALLALVPCMIADECRDAFVIGWGTGVSAGELAALASIQRVVVAEISTGVIAAAPFFENGNQHASSSPKVEIVRRDAYRALLRSQGTFDVIVSEPSNPWVTGVEMLYSREFLEAARDHLRPGGVYAQWFHTYETDRATVELVLRTYAAVFDRVSVWYTFGADLMIIGFAEGAQPDIARIEARAAQPDFAAGLRRAEIDSMPELIAHELLPLGVVHAEALHGEVHTLLHPRLSQLAARAFFLGQGADFPPMTSRKATEVGREHSLVRAWAGRHGGELPLADLKAMSDTLCETRETECAALLAYWRSRAPDSPVLAEVLERVRKEGTFAPHVEPARLEALTSFYRAEGDGGPVTPTRLREESAWFAHYYYYALPFERASLDRLFLHCREQGCSAARDAAEEVLGERAAGDGGGGA